MSLNLFLTLPLGQAEQYFRALMTPPLTRWQMAMGKSKTICQYFVDVFPLKFSRQYFTAFLQYVRIELSSINVKTLNEYLKSGQNNLQSISKRIVKIFFNRHKGWHSFKSCLPHDPATLPNLSRVKSRCVPLSPRYLFHISWQLIKSWPHDTEN